MGSHVELMFSEQTLNDSHLRALNDGFPPNEKEYKLRVFKMAYKVVVRVKRGPFANKTYLD